MQQKYREIIWKFLIRFCLKNIYMKTGSIETFIIQDWKQTVFTMNFCFRARVITGVSPDPVSRYFFLSVIGVPPGLLMFKSKLRSHIVLLKKANCSYFLTYQICKVISIIFWFYIVRLYNDYQDRYYFLNF